MRSLLPRSALALDEHGGVGVEHARDGLEDLAHGAALPDDLVEAVEALHLAPEAAVLLAEGPVEPGVLERDGGLVGEGVEERQARPREAPALGQAVEVDRADLAVLDAQRHARDRLDLLHDDALGLLVPLVLERFEDEDRLAGVEHLVHDARRDADEVAELLLGHVAAALDLEALGAVPRRQKHEAALGVERLHGDGQHLLQQFVRVLDRVDRQADLGEGLKGGLRGAGNGIGWFHVRSG